MRSPQPRSPPWDAPSASLCRHSLLNILHPLFPTVTHPAPPRPLPSLPARGGPTRASSPVLPSSPAPLGAPGQAGSVLTAVLSRHLTHTGQSTAPESRTFRRRREDSPSARCSLTCLWAGALRHLRSPRPPRRPRPQGALRLPARCHSAASSARPAAGGVPFRVCLCGAWLPLRLVFEFLTFWLLCHGWWVDLGCWLMAGRRGRVGPGGGQLALCTPVLKPSPVAGDGGESISLEV